MLRGCVGDGHRKVISCVCFERLAVRMMPAVTGSRNRVLLANKVVSEEPSMGRLGQQPFSPEQGYMQSLHNIDLKQQLLHTMQFCQPLIPLLQHSADLFPFRPAHTPAHCLQQQPLSNMLFPNVIQQFHHYWLDLYSLAHSSPFHMAQLPWSLSFHPPMYSSFPCVHFESNFR